MSKMRSPNYPAHSLSTCLDWAAKIWNSEGRTPLSTESAAVAAGYKGLSGPSRTALASLRKFGLLEDASGGLRISALALSILHSSNPEEKRDALRQAALTPGLFAQLFQTHTQASVQAIASHLITKMGFSQTGARACAEAFRDTIHFALLDEIDDSQTGSRNESEGSAEEAQVERSGSQHQVLSLTSVASLPHFRWPLANGAIAELTISRGNFTEEDLDLLCAYLNLAKRSISPAPDNT